MMPRQGNTDAGHLVILMRRLFLLKRTIAEYPHNGKVRQAEALTFALRHLSACMPRVYAEAERIARTQLDAWETEYARVRDR